MLDIHDELRDLIANLDEHEIEYALRGGMAMGVHARVRTTTDIDMLILSNSDQDLVDIKALADGDQDAQS